MWSSMKKKDSLVIWRSSKTTCGKWISRKSPLLWQRELTSTLKKIGFKPVPHEPCCLTCGGILVFFYVDDIVFAYRKQDSDTVERLTAQLWSKYNLTGGGELQWFLGIEVLRDRK